MRPSQKARKALSIPDVLYNLAYWETIKEQILEDFLPIIQAKAKAASKPAKKDLLAMSEKDAQRILYWANQNLLDANTLYTVKLFMDSLMDACYISLTALNTEYVDKLDRVEADRNYWRDQFFKSNESDVMMTEILLTHLEKTVNPTAL